MKLTTFDRVLLSIIVVLIIILVIIQISSNINLHSEDSFIIILRDIIVPIGTLTTLFLLYFTLKESQKTNKITLGKDVFFKYLDDIDKLKSGVDLSKLYYELDGVLSSKPVYNFGFSSVNMTFWVFIAFLENTVEEKEYIERLKKKDDTLLNYEDNEDFNFLKYKLKTLSRFLRNISEISKSFVPIISEIKDHEEFMSKQQYDYLISDILGFLSGYLSLCVEMKEFKTFYIINDVTYRSSKTGNFNQKEKFLPLFQDGFDFHYQVIKEMLGNITYNPSISNRN